jgi:hypothetical protein
MIQVQSLGNRELIERLSSNMARERRGDAEFLAYLGELDSRNLQLVEGHSSGELASALPSAQSAQRRRRYFSIRPMRSISEKRWR